MRVAFLGMGRMGRLTAAHILSAGHELTIWNRTPGRAAELLEQGAQEAGSVEEAVSGADAVVLMLFDGDTVDAGARADRCRRTSGNAGHRQHHDRTGRGATPR